MKSDGDLPDILAADTPAIWKSNRPAKGGASGAMLNEIIEKAAAIKAGTSPKPAAAQKPAPAKASAKGASGKPTSAKASKKPLRKSKPDRKR